MVFVVLTGLVVFYVFVLLTVVFWGETGVTNVGAIEVWFEDGCWLGWVTLYVGFTAVGLGCAENGGITVVVVVIVVGTGEGDDGAEVGEDGDDGVGTGTGTGVAGGETGVGWFCTVVIGTGFDWIVCDAYFVQFPLFWSYFWPVGHD